MMLHAHVVCADSGPQNDISDLRTSHVFWALVYVINPHVLYIENPCGNF